jgi:O-antigen/teichoic acid export membrane protein
MEAPRAGHVVSEPRSFVADAALSTVAEGTAVLLFLAGVFMARGFGPAGYGTFSFALSFCVALSMLMDGDFPNFLAREFGAAREDARRTLRRVVGLQLVGVALFGVALAAAWALLRPDAASGAMLAYAGLATVFRVAKKPLRGVLRGTGRFAFDAYSMIAERGSIVILGAVALTGLLTPESAMAIFAATRLLDTGVCALYVHHRIAPLAPDFDPTALKTIARAMVPIAVTAASWLLYNHPDSLMLGAM